VAKVTPTAEPQNADQSSRALTAEFGKLWRVPQRMGWILGGVMVLVAAALSRGPFDPLFLILSAQALVVVAWFPIAVLPATDRRLFTLFVALLRSEDKRWRRILPTERIPRGETDRRRWMAAHPVDLADPDSVGFHGALLSRLGELDAADDLTMGMSLVTPRQRFDQAFGLAQVDFLRGHSGDLTAAERSLGEITDSDDRMLAELSYAYEQAKRALISGGDWRMPHLSIPKFPWEAGLRNAIELGFLRLPIVLLGFVIGWVLALLAVALAAAPTEPS
jgi:hypothetical protein